MSKTCIYCHIVFATKNRKRAFNADNKLLLYSFIKSIIHNNNCSLVRIGGIGDHIHILIDLNPNVALARLVKSIKQSSSLWMGTNANFPLFENWQSGYFAGSVGPDGVERCKKYIDNQEEHHLKRQFIAEMEWMITKYEMQWYKEDWE